MPKGYKARDVPSRYQPLLDFLAACEGDEVTLTYRAVAALIGGSLPESAILRTSWWTSKKSPRVQVWRAMGWRAHASPAHLRVHFTRDAEEGGDDERV
jgi:hypothetical protein